MISVSMPRWDDIEKDSTAHKAFQHAFVELDARKREQYSSTHTALVQLLRSGYIETVVSFNWDTSLVIAYLREYGVALQAKGLGLYKPDGDAFGPDSDSILPHQPSIVPDVILDRVKELDDTGPHVLLILRYSEHDKEIACQADVDAAAAYALAGNVRFTSPSERYGGLHSCTRGRLHRTARAYNQYAHSARAATTGGEAPDTAWGDDRPTRNPGCRQHTP